MEKRGYGQKILNTTIDNNSSCFHAHKGKINSIASGTENSIAGIHCIKLIKPDTILL